MTFTATFKSLPAETRKRILHRVINIQAMRVYRHAAQDDKRYNRKQEGNALPGLFNMIVMGESYDKA